MDTEEIVMAIPGYITVPQAAEMIGVTAGRVHQIISAGLLTKVPISKRAVLVPIMEVKRIAANPSKVGRPRSRSRKAS